MSTDSASETQFWVICPVCEQANPLGTHYCKYCWGAVLHSNSPVLSSQEVEESAKRRLSSLKRKKAFRVRAISFFSLVAFVITAYLGLYYSTDILSKPPHGVNSNSSPGEWAMFRHDVSRSGATDSSSTLPRGTVKWVFPTGNAIHSSPAIADGVVYIGSRDYKLYALDAATGTKRWEYQTGSWVESSPTVANGVVYIGSNDGNLHAVNAYSGKKLWSFKTYYAIASSPAVAKGVVYFGSDDYHIYALDAKKGTKLWSFNTEGHVQSSPVVANGIVYAGSSNNFCYALHAISGRFRLHFKSYTGSVYSSPVVSGDTVYFSNSDGLLYAFKANARSVLWEHFFRPYWVQLWILGVPVPRPVPQSGFLWQLKLGNKANSSPVVVGNTMFVGAGNKLLAIDLQSHKKLWEFETKGAITSSPAAAGAAVYVGSEDGNLYAVNAVTGEKLWNISTGGKITSSPAIADGVVYIGSHDGNLYAIE